MAPLFTTLAPGRAGWSNTSRPAAAFAAVMPGAEATSAFTSTCAPEANTIPDWLAITTRPLEVSRPAITEGSGPTTRLMVTDCAFGSTKATCAWAPIEKFCQLIAAFWVACVTVMVVPPVSMRATPPITCPPVGSSVGATLCAPAGGASTTTVSTAACKAVARSSAARGMRSWTTGMAPCLALRPSGRMLARRVMSVPLGVIRSVSAHASRSRPHEAEPPRWYCPAAGVSRGPRPPGRTRCTG